MTTERARALAVVSLLAALLALAIVRRPPGAVVPPRTPASACQPWMADSLPGVGRKSRETATAAIRAGEFAELPPAARALAPELFDGGP